MGKRFGWMDGHGDGLEGLSLGIRTEFGRRCHQVFAAAQGAGLIDGAGFVFEERARDTEVEIAKRQSADGDGVGDVLAFNDGEELQIYLCLTGCVTRW